MTPAVSLQNVTKEFGDIVAVRELMLDVADGEFFALLGPSGCGKTTTLRMVAGFEQPSAGEVYIMGQPVANVPAFRRPVNTVFQSYALFPHMTVAQNVAFGLEMKQIPKAEIRQRVADALELVEMSGMDSRRSKQLSGGQQQRVALARALVNRPEVLLLDEPLGALDLKLRKTMQLELKQIQADVGITFIYVTHDQEEAMTMSDRIAVMNAGVVQQIGAPREIYEQPVNRFVADFIGETNFIEGIVGRVDTDTGIATVMQNGLSLCGRIVNQNLAPTQAVTLAVRPEKIRLSPATQDEMSTPSIDESLDGPSQNATRVTGHVMDVIYIGTDTRYQIALTDQVSVFVRVQNLDADSDTFYTIGDSVCVSWFAQNAQILTE